MTIGIESYGNYRHKNYGAHTIKVDIDGLTVWFSYKTPIAFWLPPEKVIMRVNDWNRTTGGHLQAVKHSRYGDVLVVSGNVFERRLEAALARVGRHPTGTLGLRPGWAEVEETVNEIENAAMKAESLYWRLRGQAKADLEEFLDVLLVATGKLMDIVDQRRPHPKSAKTPRLGLAPPTPTQERFARIAQTESKRRG